MRYTKIPTTTFQNLVLNAGVVAENFDPGTGEFTGQIGATSGGSSFNATPAFIDRGDGLDNCPKNMMELKDIESWDINLSGTLATVNLEVAEMLIAACDASGNKLVPRANLKIADFKDLWFICDYSDQNDGSNAGFIAIKVMNALNTGGFQLQSADKDKGKFSFTFTAHFSMENQETVPFEVYVKSGASLQPFVSFDSHIVNITVDEELGLGYVVNPSDATITFSSSAGSVVSVTSEGVVKGLDTGSAIITASITDSGVSYSDTCTVIVSAG